MRTEMPLPAEDCQTMNCKPSQVFETIRRLPAATQPHVKAATHRLSEVHWITDRLEKEIKRRGRPIAQEGLLSLQVYLLLTCADTLGHVYITSGGVGKRFKAFFDKLPQDAKQKLVDGILTWRTSLPDLISLGLVNAQNWWVKHPSRQEIVQAIQPLAFSERLDAVVNLLYLRRNMYTHESRYPELGFHPALSVMQNLRLNLPNTADLGELNRLQVITKDDDFYIALYETDDVIATVRWSIVRGLGRIMGCV
jgi:hypothetical protein